MASLRLIIDEKRTRKLVDLGFVNVTGLPTQSMPNEPGEPIQAQRSQLGKHDYNNGKMVVVTEDGEVWLRGGHLDPSLLGDICPKGNGAFVPCTNGESINGSYLLERVANPFCTCSEQFSPVPKIK